VIVPPWGLQTMNRPPINDLLRLIAEGTAGVTGEAFFQSLVRHMALAPQCGHTLTEAGSSAK